MEINKIEEKSVEIKTNKKYRKILAFERPDLIEEWNFEKNADICAPDEVTVWSTKKVWWKCKNGHEWQSTIGNRNMGNGCPYCSNKRVLKGFTDLATLNPELAKEWHPTKNGTLTPDIVSVGSERKVWWRCSHGHEWQATIASRNSGRSCPYCSNKKVLKGYNDLLSTYPEIASEWHPTKNGDLKPDMITSGSNKKVWWQCSHGHEWQAIVADRKNGRGCPYCSSHRVEKGFNDLVTLNPELAKEWHPTKNESITPEMVAPNSNKKVWWQCSYGHEWQSTVTSRTRGSRCPVCQKQLHTSFPEQAVFFYVKQAFPNAINGFKDIFINGMELDIYIPELRVGIEYDGFAWHSDNLSKKRELIKYKICKENSIPLIRIKERKDIKRVNIKNSDEVIYISKSPKNDEIETVLEELFCLLHAPLLNFNVENDENRIYEQYVSGMKSHSLAEELPNIALEWHPTKNGSLTPEMVTAGSNKKVWWQCSHGHEWQAIVADRKNGRGCPYCSGHRVAKGFNDLATLNPELAKEWHPTKNGSLTPEMVAPNSNKKVWWKCEKDHEWSAYISNRNRGNKCPYCAGIAKHSVLCVETNTTYKSINEAARSTNINAGGIASCCKGKQNTAGEYHWIYCEAV